MYTGLSVVKMDTLVVGKISAKPGEGDRRIRSRDQTDPAAFILSLECLMKF
jgi:hypothetical protein